MSEKQYYRKLLLAVQDKIRGLGATNRNRWAAFCYNKSMSYDEFVGKMDKYNVQYEPGDLRVIWDSVGITSDDMNFQDFLKLMQADVDELNPVKSGRGSTGRAPPANDYYADQPSYGAPAPSYGAPASRGGAMGDSCVDIIHENLRDIVIGCMSRDSLMTGEISRNGFVDVCASYGVRESMPGFSRLVSIGDASGSGLIQYFTVAAHVCSTAAVPANDPPMRRGFEQPAFDDPPMRRGFEQPAFDEPPRRGGYEPEETPVQRRTAYESSIAFGESPATSAVGNPSQRRTAYESSISFGVDPAPRQTFSRGSSGYGSGGYGSGGYGSGSGSGAGFDEFANMERGSTNPNEVLKNISLKVTENIGNSKQAYQKWRGMKDKLGAEEIRQGLIRDCKYVVPIDVLQEICSRYGGQLNLTGFVRMMGDGTSIAEETPRRSSGGRSMGMPDRPMTDDDRTIEDIALQLQGKDWENVVSRARNADDLCRAFQKLGCRVDENRVRVLVSKQGRNGFLDSIQDHIGN